MSAERAVLDTTEEIADEVALISQSLAITTITLSELQFGVLVTTSAKCAPSDLGS